MDPKATKVLLLDDDPNMRSVLSNILKVKGFEPIPVGTGAAALARIEQQDIAVVLVDLRLKDKSGMDVMRGITARSPKTECIILTGQPSQSSAIEAINLGAFSYFQKPYDVDQLLLSIRRAAEKHSAGHALHESEAHFRSMIENSTDLIVILNSDATLRYASPSIEPVLGYSSDENLGGTALQDFIHPDDIPAFKKAFHKCIQASDSSPVSMHLRIRHENGSWRTFEGTGSNLLGHPAIAGIILNAHDITERKRAEAERQSLLEIMQGMAVSGNLQDLLQLIHKSLSKVIYAENCFVVFHNKRSGLFEEVYAVDEYDERTPPTKLGKSITSYVFHTSEPLLLTQAKFDDLVARGEVELVGTNSLSWLGAPLKTPRETIGVIVVQNYEAANCYSDRDRDFLASVGMQVSLAIERKQTEEAVRRSESSLHAVLQSTADGILAVSSENSVLYTNERFVEMWRIPQVVMASQDDTVLLKHVLAQLTDPQSFLKKVQRLYKSDEESFDTLHFKDGRVFERLSHPLMQEAKVCGRVWSFRDVTARKQVEGDLLRSQESTIHANRLLLALNQAAQAVQLASTTEEVYAAIQNEFAQLGCHATGFELSEDGQKLHIAYLNYRADLVRKAEKATGLSLRDFRFSWRKGSLYQRAIVKGETIFIEEASRAVIDTLPKKLHSLGRPITKLLKLDQAIFAPLKVRNETIGILAITGPDLTEADNPAVTAFANQVAIAVQNTRLYQQAIHEAAVRKQAEESLAVSEAELRALFASMHDVVLVIDRLGVYLKIAPTNPELLVKPPEELLGKTLRDVFPSEQAETFINVMFQVLDTKQTQQIEYDLIIDGQTVWFEASISPMTNDTILWMARDVTERKLIGDKVEEERILLRTLIDNLPDRIFVLDVHGRKVISNIADWQAAGGKKMEDVIGKTDLDTYPPELAKDFWALDKTVIDTGIAVIDYEEPGFDALGRPVSVLSSKVPLWDSHGKVIGLVGIGHDITERKLTEEALKESQQSYRELVERIPGVIYRDALDEKASTLFIGPLIKDLTGYSSEEWVADPDLWLKLLHPDDRTRVIAENKHHLETGEQFRSDYRLLARDGRIVWVRDEAVSICDSSGHPLYDQGIFIDITERKLAEEKIHLSEERYRILAENMSDTIWLMDMSLRTTYISPSVTRLRGFTLDDINTIPLDQQMSSDSFQRTLQLFAEILSPENLTLPDRYISRTIELEYFKKDGTMFWSENTFTLICDPQGQAIAILGSGRDISERKTAQESLQKSEKYFRALIENNTDAVVLVDPRGLILFESPAYTRIIARDSVHRLGTSMYEDIHTEDRGILAHTLTELVQHPGEIRQISFRNQHVDGSLRWIEATATNLLGEMAVHGLVINMHDITERKLVDEEIRHRVSELEVLHESGLSINVLLEPEIIAEKVIEILYNKLDWPIAAIRLVNPATKRIEFVAFNKTNLKPDENRAEIDQLNKIFGFSDHGLSGWVIRHGKTIRCGDVRADKRYLSTFPEVRSGLYVPMMIGERAIGSIGVESQQLNRFSAEDERLLQTLAAQSAIALENARLYQEAVSAEKRKTALHQGGIEIVRAGQEIEALCVALHHAALQVMPVDVCIVSLLTEDGHQVDAPYFYDRGIRHPNTRLPAEAGVTGRVIKSKKPLLLKDVQKSRGVKPIIIDGSEPTRSVLSVPLLTQERLIGVVSVQSRASDVYSGEDQVFMETLASEAAVAFENARLFKEIRSHLTELESLSQVSDSLTSTIELLPLLEDILAGARSAIPAAEKGTILLAEPDGVLRLHAMSGYSDSRLIGLVLRGQKGYAVHVARERNPIKIDDAKVEYGIPHQGMIEEIDAVQSGIAAPLIVKGKMIGVISLDNASRKAAFTESDLRLLVTFASSAAVAIENVRLFTETQQRLHHLSALHSIDAAISASVDMKVTLSIVLDHVLADLHADAAVILLFNQLTRTLDYSAGVGFRSHVIEGLQLRLGEGLAGRSVQQRRAIHITDLYQADGVEAGLEDTISVSALAALKYLEVEDFVSYHAIPLIAKGQMQGVLEIFKRSPLPVDQEWITFSEMLAGQTALAIDNGHLFENLQRSNLELTLAYDATIQGWSQALELRDEETEGHTLRVTDMTLRLIQAMGLKQEEIEHARRGSLLHDIGKIAVPDSILLKPGPLDEHEWSVMRQHPQYAYNMLSPIAYLAPAIHIPWCHHEKWDGSGYPRGLKGEAIPLVARLFAIVDVYDALTSNRPYRQAWTVDKALEYIRAHTGTHFDPKVVEAFLDLLAGEK